MRKQWTKQEPIDFESEIGVLYENNQLPFLFHLSGGNEDQLIDIFSQINEGDWVISNHRSHYHTSSGIPPEIVKQRIIDGRACSSMITNGSSLSLQSLVELLPLLLELPGR